MYEDHQEELEQHSKITMQDILDHMTGPVISVVTHIVLIALIGSIIVFQKEQPQKNIVVNVKEVKIIEPPKPPDVPKPPEDIPIVDSQVEYDKPAVDNQPINDLQVVEEVGVETTMEVELPSLLTMKPSNSKLVINGIYSKRGKPGSGKGFGETTETNKRVIKALHWLRDNQNPDGSWGDNAGQKPALTGLAVLTFLAHGVTPNTVRDDFGTCLAKGIKRCVKYVDDGNNGKVICDAHGYGHSIVAYALCESYALTNIPMVKYAMDKSIQVIVNGQNKSGSFNYNYKDGREDLSYAGWNFQALKASFIAGSDVDGIADAIDKGCKSITTVHKGGKGSFNYSRGKGTTTMTAVGTLCLQLFGRNESQDVINGVKYLVTNANEVKWDGQNKSQMAWALYRWYYQTQVMFQHGKGKSVAWMKWNKAFTTEFFKRQFKDGHWEPPTGNHESRSLTGINGSIYATTLCALSLQIYTRYLPSFKIQKTVVKEEDIDDE